MSESVVPLSPVETLIGALRDTACPEDKVCTTLWPDDANNWCEWCLKALLSRAADALASAHQAQETLQQAISAFPDELTKEACDRCEQCGPRVMCSFHSLLSLLVGDTHALTPAPRSQEESPDR